MRTAKDLLEWNDVLPNVSVVDTTPEGNATQFFAVMADYGWAQRILCEGCYHQDAEAICLALQEAMER